MKIISFTVVSILHLALLDTRSSSWTDSEVVEVVVVFVVVYKNTNKNSKYILASLVIYIE